MAATLTVDTTGQIRSWSREAEELLGYSRSEAVGQSIEIIIPPHLRDRHWAGFRQICADGDQRLAGSRHHNSRSQDRPDS